jgi:hypothetical protein
MAYYLFIKGIENMTENWDELCDEEKSFNEWFKENNSLIYDSFDVTLEIYKNIYMQGYAAGFQSKLKYSSEEHLQK